jgi:hypothetical protein
MSRALHQPIYRLRTNPPRARLILPRTRWQARRARVGCCFSSAGNACLLRHRSSAGVLNVRVVVGFSLVRRPSGTVPQSHTDNIEAALGKRRTAFARPFRHSTITEKKLQIGEHSLSVHRSRKRFAQATLQANRYDVIKDRGRTAPGDRRDDAPTATGKADRLRGLANR